jgi:serine/threonine protein kinase
VTEYVGPTTLYNALHKSKSALTGTQRTRIAMGIAAGMTRLAELGVIHRNLNSTHILLDDQMLPRISDFADARFAATADQGPLTSRLGTPAWAAPEMFIAQSYNGKVDVYSFGMILFELISGTIPFHAMKANEIINTLMRRHERPPLPARTSAGWRSLFELCWAGVPDRRISFGRAYELFETGRVLFEGTEADEVDKIAAVVREWREALDPGAEELTLRKVMAVLKSGDPLAGLSMAERVTVATFPHFLRAVLVLVNSKESEDMIATALFDVLHIISRDQECLAHFAQSVPWADLPISSPRLGKIAFSLVIPVLEKYPRTADGELLPIIRAQIPSQPVKALRLIEIITDAMTDETFDLRAASVLIDSGDAFIAHGAGKVYLNIVFKLLRRLRSFRAHRAKHALPVMVRALSSTDPETVSTALTVLSSLRPITISIENATLLALLEQEEYCNQTLKLLIVSKPVNVGIELIQWLVAHSKNDFAIVVLLSLCRTSDVSELLVANPDVWLGQEDLAIPIQFRVVLLLMYHRENKRPIMAFPNLAQLFVGIVSGGQLDAIGAVAVIIDKLPPDRDFLARLVDAGLVSSLINFVLTRTDPELLANGYLFVQTMSHFGYLDDFALFIPLAIDHISDPKLSLSALRYLTLMAEFPEGVSKLKEGQLSAVLVAKTSQLPEETKTLAEGLLLKVIR